MSDDPKLPFEPQGHLEAGAKPEEYQPDTMSPRGLGLFILALFAFIALGLVVTGILFAVLRSRPNSAVLYDEPLPPQAGPAGVWVNEPYAYRRYFDEEMQHLDRYRWIDRRRGIVQIPIERAMDLLLSERKASSRPAASQPPLSRPTKGGAP